MRKGMSSKGIAVLLCFTAGLLFGSPAGAQNQSSYSVSNKAKIQVSGAFGFGADSQTIGTMSTGDPVKISAGGGSGLAVGAGYALSDRFDLDFDLGFQVSTLTPAVSNADGTFTRSYLLATAKYKVPVNPTMQLKFGLGAGSYRGGTWDTDTSAAPGGSKLTVDYGDAMGFHGIGEVEFTIGNDLFFTFGLKYYAITYKADSVTYNGAPGNLAGLSSDLRNLNGSGLDLLAAFGKYF